MTARAFTDALRALAPAALILRQRERDWCSSGLYGKTVAVDILWPNADAGLDDFLARLPEADFPIQTLFVADIVATRCGSTDGGEAIRIEALLLLEDV